MTRFSRHFTWVILAAAIVPAQTLSSQSSARAYALKKERDILSEFISLLSIPNVASDTTGIRRNADFITAAMERRGLSPRLLRAKDPAAPPLIYGEWKAPGATTTLMLYAHYDGQPTVASKWTGSDPWVPVLRNAPLERGGQTISLPPENQKINPEYRIYARSASDDKAGVMAFLAAIDAIKASHSAPSMNLKFVFDGEEEAGSPHLGEIIRANKELLESDAWVICDGPVHQSGRKQVVYGVRGDENVDITVYSANRPLHSGHYGNWAPNPAML